MISYKPLCITLEKKGKDVQYLSSMLNIDKEKLRDILNNNKELSLSKLFKICSDLDCKLEDVIQWVEKPVYVNVNWGKVNKPLTQLSVECGLHRATLCNAKKKGARIRFDTAKKVAKVLDCKLEDIVC